MYKNLKGKTVCFLGDSITDGFAVNKGERYFEVLSERLGFNAFGYGVCGANFAALYRQAEQMYAEHAENVDIIFIFAGTNDFNGSIPLGEWFSYGEAPVVRQKNPDGTPAVTEIRLKRSPNVDASTCRGAISRLLIFLKEHYGDKRIILLTPLHRAFAEFSCTNIQYDESYSNGARLFIDDYVSTVREAASLYSCELIDLFAYSGIYPLSDISAKAYLASTETDRLHPSKEGHARIADVIEGYLL